MVHCKRGCLSDPLLGKSLPPSVRAPTRTTYLCGILGGTWGSKWTSVPKPPPPPTADADSQRRWLSQGPRDQCFHHKGLLQEGLLGSQLFVGGKSRTSQTNFPVVSQVPPVGSSAPSGKEAARDGMGSCTGKGAQNRMPIPRRWAVSEHPRAHCVGV